MSWINYDSTKSSQLVIVEGEPGVSVGGDVPGGHRNPVQEVGGDDAGDGDTVVQDGEGVLYQHFIVRGNS